MNYADFIERKSQLGTMSGFDPISMPDFLFDFQKSLIEWSLRKGRAAIFADCGLGKTIIQLVWADNVVRKSNRPVLILTPLAVSHQTLAEAEKFGIEAKRSHAGPHNGIVITNYEKLHHFDSTDFSGCVCDECFAPGTEIETLTGKMHIENIHEGMYVLNASGIDRVSDVHRREVPYAVRVTTASASFIASPNHPIFTQRGWVGAQHLRPGDYALESGAAMRLVRESICSEIPGTESATVLRQILLSEMAHDTAGNLGESPFQGSGCEERNKEECLASVWRPESQEGDGAHYCSQSFSSARSPEENQPHIESHGLRSFRTWGKWSSNADTAIDYDGCIGQRLDGGISIVSGPTESRLANALQNRLRQSEIENRDRGGWSISCEYKEKDIGYQKGRFPGWVRLDGAEILEPGNPDLEKFRNADGKLYFYDLGATRHPSYSVGGLLVHNSSILKSFDGERRQQITEFMRKLPYRLLCTATAAPNDYIELGTSSEALGELGYTDMLTKFFKNDQNTIKPMTYRHRGENFAQKEEAAKWRFKGHAEVPFWRWVCSWARAVRRPSDLGFSDDRFVLPELIERDHLIEFDKPADGMLFSLPAVGLAEQRDERRRTIVDRCEKAASLINGHHAALAWCHLNDEGDLLTRLITGAAQVSGDDADEAKEEKFLAFIGGQIRVLVTKQRIAGWGLNLQHCNHMTTFPSHSFEGYYQAVRRCWRFGQKLPVTVDIVTSEGEKSVLKNLQRKAKAADAMFSGLVAHMNDARSLDRSVSFTKNAEVPSWLR